MNINLPAEPVHLYEITFWSTDYDTVRKVRWVYHVFTRWQDFDPDNPGGCNIKNEWMIYLGDSCQGRACGGWQAPIKEFENATKLYDNEKDAVCAVRDRVFKKARSYEELAREAWEEAAQLMARLAKL